MGNHAGFDTATYPGSPQLAWLKANTNLEWCGYYLAPAPSHRDTGWMGERQLLSAQGWGLAPIFVGQQTAGPGAHQAVGALGGSDGVLASRLAASEGFAPQSCIYLDWEDGGNPSQDACAYIAAWAAAVAAARFQPGIYCSHRLAPTMAALIGDASPGSIPRVWAWKVALAAQHPYVGSTHCFPDADPAGCGYPAALAWQCEQNCTVALADAPTASMLVDLSCARIANPGAPGAGA